MEGIDHEIFIDTANLEDIKKHINLSFSWCYNESFFSSKEGIKFEDRIAEICQAVPKVESVSAEVTPDAVTAEEMIARRGTD